MTTATSTFSWLNDTTANLKTTIDKISALITTAGLVRTTDSNQLDTNNLGGTTNTSGLNFGYQVYKFPDTLQATTPILMRTSFRTDQSGRLYVQLIVGSASDGNGTISAPSITSAQDGFGAYQANLTSYACYIDGTFSMVLGYGAVSGGTSNNTLGAVVIDRARDNTGTALSNGFLVEMPTVNGTANIGTRSLYGPASPATTTWVPSLIPSAYATSSAEGSNVNVFRHYMMVPGVRASLGSLSYYYSEFGALTPFSATVLGSSHTYLPMGYGLNYWSAVPTNTHCAAIRWE